MTLMCVLALETLKNLTEHSDNYLII